MIRYTMKTDSTAFLGPGNRAVLWVHGCQAHCPGCIAADMNAGAPPFRETPESLAAWFLSTGADGLTISGGEPFLQARELAAFLTRVREARPAVNVIVYTGFLWEELNDPAHRLLLDRIDLLIDGPYQEERNSGFFGIGSDNQRLIRLSDRISDQAIRSYYQRDRGREVSLHVDEAGVSLIGVPSRAQMEVWRQVKSRILNEKQQRKEDVS